jgi:hypothetical protein
MNSGFIGGYSKMPDRAIPDSDARSGSPIKPFAMDSDSEENYEHQLS